MGLCGYEVVRFYGYEVVRFYGYEVMRLCGCKVVRFYGYAESKKSVAFCHSGLRPGIQLQSPNQ